MTLSLACSNGATVAGDDAALTDLGASNDLARDVGRDVGTADNAADVGRDAGSAVDAAFVDAATDAADGDAAAIVHPDVPGMMLGGYFIPVDPNAVPPPGSECTGDGGVRDGDPTIAPPRPIRPLSVSRVTSQRPTFQWALPDGTTGAHIEVCADRCCTRVLQSFDADGTTARPATALPPGVVFWRMFGRRRTVVGSRASYTWEFGVRHRDAPNDTSWGTIRDFNGDGFDDLVVMAQRAATADRTAEAWLVPGSAHGFQPPLRSGVVNPRLPDVGSAGDFNGDGIADLVWSNRTSDGSLDSWIEVLAGGRDGLRRLIRIDIDGVEGCPNPFISRTVDWNGDGYSDVIASVLLRCGSGTPDASFLFIYYGSSRGLSDIPQAVTRIDNLFLHRFTYAESDLGDIDLDGYGDLYIISRYTSGDSTDPPAEHIIAYGSPVGTPRYERIRGPSTSAQALATPLGDIDGDGHGDWSLWTQDRWAVDVYRYVSGLNDPSETLMDNTARYSGDQFGIGVGGGDLNGDGLSDVVVSAADSFDEIHGSTPVDRGRTYVYPGMTGGLSQIPGLIIHRPDIEDGGASVGYFGAHAMSPGDVNGDGLDDIVMKDSFDPGVCFVFGRTVLDVTRPDGCFLGGWPSYDLFL